MIKTFLLPLLIIAGLLYGGAVAVYNLKPHNTPIPAFTIDHSRDVTMEQIQQATATADPILASDMNRLGLDYKDITVRFSTNLPAGTAGHYDAQTKTIEVDAPLTGVARDVVLSHEYIHYVQFTKPGSYAESFYGYMDQLIQNNTYLHSRVASMLANGQLEAGSKVESEAEAFACTELPDSALNSDFVGFCNSVLPTREALL